MDIHGKLKQYLRRMEASGHPKPGSSVKAGGNTGIAYEELFYFDLSLGLFDRFNRHQVVNWCWRKKDGKWALQNIPFTEEWDQDGKAALVDSLKRTLQSGGIVIGAFSNQSVIGFASVESQSFGPDLEYVQLSNLHVSFEYRGKGIGKRLFKMACNAARALGARKLYISAHSAEETQAFYKSMKCKEAEFYCAKLVMKEPCDCQLEYVL